MQFNKTATCEWMICSKSQALNSDNELRTIKVCFDFMDMLILSQRSSSYGLGTRFYWSVSGKVRNKIYLNNLAFSAAASETDVSVKILAGKSTIHVASANSWRSVF